MTWPARAGPPRPGRWTRRRWRRPCRRFVATHARPAGHRHRAARRGARQPGQPDLWQVAIPAGQERRPRARRPARAPPSATATWSSSAPRPGATCARGCRPPSARAGPGRGLRARRRARPRGRGRTASRASSSSPSRRRSSSTARRSPGRSGAGYDHRLVWTFVFRRPPDDARWEVMVDATSGEVVAFQDINQYAQRADQRAAFIP